VERIVRALTREVPLDVRRLLVRLGGAAQKGLDFEQRRTNLRGMIRVRERAIVPARVVLLDDVFTTGATADACAGALHEAGCGEVCVLTLAIEL
jgi:predicted amidophosphoribosyltransferase